MNVLYFIHHFCRSFVLLLSVRDGYSFLYLVSYFAFDYGYSKEECNIKAPHTTQTHSPTGKPSIYRHCRRSNNTLTLSLCLSTFVPRKFPCSNECVFNNKPQRQWTLTVACTPDRNAFVYKYPSFIKDSNLVNHTKPYHNSNNNDHNNNTDTKETKNGSDLVQYWHSACV